MRGSVDVDRARVGHPLEALIDDAAALLQLVDAHHEAIEAVAGGADRNVEVDLAVLEVRVRLPDVVGDAAGAQARARPAERDRVFLADDADVLEAVEEDAVAEQQALALGHDVQDLAR